MARASQVGADLTQSREVYQRSGRDQSTNRLDALPQDYDPTMNEAIGIRRIARPNHRPFGSSRSEHDVAHLIDAWPVDTPLIVLHSGRTEPRQARWTILSTPIEWLVTSDADEPLQPLERAFSRHSVDPALKPDLPFLGGWIGSIGYDAARTLEPAVNRLNSIDDRHWPRSMFAWCPAAILLDHLTKEWLLIGLSDAADALAESFEKARTRAESHAGEALTSAAIGPITATTTDAQHRAAVERTLEYIAAGDIFQANITRRWTVPFSGSPRAIWRAANRVSPAWFGALIEGPDNRALVSMSPELFLRVDPRSRRVTSRPIKGTRPAHLHPDELRASEKDAAELHMIVDLMRNDLGRVCRFGSVRVRESRAIETHPTVHHGVAEVEGELRDDSSIFDLLRASFPPGSVTGAPKIRAMQIIDELEPVRRGPYCGTIGFIDRRGGMSMNVAIRTVAIHGSTLDYHAGGGIVADSDPEAEVAETHAKAAVFRELTARLNPVSPRSVPDRGGPGVRDRCAARDIESMNP